MAFTLTQLQALESAIAAGELTVEYDGKRVTYRGMHELMQARDLVRGELAAAGQLQPEPRISYVEFDKG
jgi:roadblock/LC7 domain-containing protein